MTVVTLPAFLTAPVDAVSVGPWLVRQSDGAEAEVGEFFRGWDAATAIRLRRGIAVNEGAVRAACRLRNDDRLALTCRWTASATALKGSSQPVALAGSDDEHSYALALEVPGAWLGGTLSLRAALILVHATQPRDLLAARLPGSTLWQDADPTRVDLEGSADDSRWRSSSSDGATLYRWAPLGISTGIQATCLSQSSDPCD